MLVDCGKVGSKSRERILHCSGPQHNSLLAVSNRGENCLGTAKCRVHKVELSGCRVLVLVKKDVRIGCAKRFEKDWIEPQQIGCKSIQHRKHRTGLARRTVQLRPPPS